MTENVSINTNEYVIRNEHVIKLLALYVDDLLNFDDRVDNTCSKAGRKAECSCYARWCLNREVIYLLSFI